MFKQLVAGSPTATSGSARRPFAVALPIGVAAFAYGVPFGVLGVASGLTAFQVQFLSLAMFGGAAQLALVGAVATGSSIAGATATAIVLGTRAFFYSASLRRDFPTWRSRFAVAQLVSDESVAAAHAFRPSGQARSAFLITGIWVYVCWNIATAVGALAGATISDPRTLGLDVVSSAALLALIGAQLRSRQGLSRFLAAMSLAIVTTPFLPAGVPILVAGASGVLSVPRWGRRS